MHRILSQVLRESDFSIEILERSSDATGRYVLQQAEQAVENDLVLFGICTTPGISSYYLVIFVDNIPNNFVQDEVPSYFIALREYLKKRFVPAMPKNFSLIVCWKQARANASDEMNPKILQIEEDPYDFKKYVLVYTQSEVDALRQEWQTSQLSLLSFLNNFLYQEGNFMLFKDQEAPPAYRLATRLFVKVPFLRVQVNEQLFEDLQDVIRSSLGEELTTLRNELLELNQEELMEALQETELDQE